MLSYLWIYKDLFMKENITVLKVRTFGKNAYFWAKGFTRSGDYYIGTVTVSEGIKIAKKCREKGFKYSFSESRWQRNSSYRKDFFESFPPQILNKYYICAYCGKWMRPENTTVDHIYPVAAVRENLRLQRKMKRRGIDGVNSVKNLCPACESCNKRKSAKLGKWQSRGFIGRNKSIWVFRYILRFAIAAVLIGFFAYLIMSHRTLVSLFV